MPRQHNRICFCIFYGRAHRLRRPAQRHCSARGQHLVVDLRRQLLKSILELEAMLSRLDLTALRVHVQWPGGLRRIRHRCGQQLRIPRRPALAQRRRRWAQRSVADAASSWAQSRRGPAAVRDSVLSSTRAQHLYQAPGHTALQYQKERTSRSKPHRYPPDTGGPTGRWGRSIKHKAPTGACARPAHTLLL